MEGRICRKKGREIEMKEKREKQEQEEVEKNGEEKRKL